MIQRLLHSPGIRYQKRSRRRRRALIDATSDYRVEVRSALDGSLVRVYEGENILLDEGLTWWLYNMFNDISGSTDQGELKTIDIGSGSTAATRSDTDCATLLTSYDSGLRRLLLGETLQLSFFLASHEENSNTIREYLIRSSVTTGSQASAQAITRVVLPEDIPKTDDITISITHRISIRRHEQMYDGTNLDTAVITKLGRQWAVSRLVDYTTEYCDRCVVGSAGIVAGDPEVDSWLGGGSTASDQLDSAPVSGQSVTPNGQFTSGAAAFTAVEAVLAKDTTDHMLFFVGDFSLNGSAKALDYDWEIIIASRLPWIVGVATATVTSDTSVGVAVPDGVMDGDVLYAIVSQRINSTFTAPGGWTSRDDHTRTTILHQQIFTRTADNEEGVTHTFTSDTSSNFRVTLLVVRLADTSSPVDAVSSNDSNGTTITAPTVSAANPTRHLVIYTRRNAGTTTAHAARYDDVIGFEVATPTIHIDQRGVDNGASGTKDLTVASAVSWIATGLMIGIDGGKH